MMTELEERNARAISDPYSFGAVDPGVSAGVARDAQRLALQTYDQEVTGRAIDLGMSSIKGGRQWVPQDIDLSSGKLTAKEQADAIIEQRWGEIQAQTQDPTERMMLLTRDLALVPGGTSAAIAQAVAGIPALAYSAASEQDPEARAKLFTDLSNARATYEAVYAVNPEVANRHLARESDAETVEYIRLALDTIPADDTAALRAAMGAVRSPRRFSDIKAAPATRKLAEAAVKDAGLSGAPLALAEEVRDRIAVLSSGLGMSPEQAKTEVVKQLRDTWQLRKGQLLKTGDARSGSRLDVDTLEAILLETVPESDRDGLRLGQEPNGGWLLMDERGLPATEFLTGAEALGIVSQATEYGSGISGERQRQLAVQRREDEQAAGVNDTGALADITRAIPRVVRSRQLTSMFNRYHSKIAEARIAAENGPLNKAVLIVGSRMAGVLREPEQYPVDPSRNMTVPEPFIPSGRRGF
jgi:hypothetical protein